jgi:hypothetical protein
MSLPSFYAPWKYTKRAKPERCLAFIYSGLLVIVKKKPPRLLPPPSEFSVALQKSGALRRCASTIQPNASHRGQFGLTNPVIYAIFLLDF